MKQVIYIFIFLSLFFFSLSLCGCGSQCIKIGGAYSGVSGTIFYCFDSEKTKTNEITTLQDSQGKENVVIPKTDLEKIFDSILVSKTFQENKIRVNAIGKQFREVLLWIQKQDKKE